MGNFYLAYGSNMNLYQMSVRCPTAKVIGTAILEGYELIFQGVKGDAYATIRKNPKKNTPVLVWELDDLAEYRLDNYEGFPTFYGKAFFRVDMEGKPVKAMAYVMKRVIPLGIPERHYYEGIYAGYLAAGFDTAILEEAVRVSDPESE
ncbi:MAG: gamma-glutamylcyclotransferase [Desulfosporosinus sp.]|nr:gamma-glutamylcyclotransferase [Desulfosporosinus sp.]